MSGVTVFTMVGNPEMKRCQKKGHPRAFRTAFAGYYCPVCERNVDKEINKNENK